MLDDLVAGRNLVRRAGELLLLMAIGASAYGAVLGLWRGPTQACYAFVKLPLVLLVTSALTMVFNWMLALLMGVRMSFAQATALTMLCLAVASVVLASLAPVALLFSLSAPEPSTKAQTAHNLLYLFHTLFIAGAGMAGTRVLKAALDRICRDLSKSRRLRRSWVLVFAFVGGEVAWSLRPFVGSVYLPVVFLRADAFNGNMYEFMITDIFPHLLGRR